MLRSLYRILFVSSTILFSLPAWAGYQNFINDLFGQVNSIIASVFFFNVLFFVDGVEVPLAVAWLVCGAIYFTFKMRFVNIRCFKHAIELTMGRFDSGKSTGEVSHFKALATALSATVGLGNIAGVAIAISLGGPGATFWMILAGFLGMTSKFTECSLAQMYRTTRPDGHVLGGPMLYLEEGFSRIGWKKLGKFLAVAFAMLCIGGSFGGGGSFQVNQSLNAIAEVLPFFWSHKWVYGLIMSFLVGVVIIGGIKRIANVAEKIVPLMCTIYVLMALYILVLNAHMIPFAFSQILYGAFSPESMYGGFIGVLVTGFKRAAFSNEAGVGSAAIAHSAAKSEHPIQEGLVSLLEPFIDTILICTMTALVIIITGAYQNPEYIDLIHRQNGAALTSRALAEGNLAFPYILGGMVFLFAFSTIISWSYYGERSFAFLFGEKYSMAYKIALLVVIFLGAITTSANVLEFGDLMILGMAFPSIVGSLAFSGQVKEKLNEYCQMLKDGRIKRKA